MAEEKKTSRELEKMLGELNSNIQKGSDNPPKKARQKPAEEKNTDNGGERQPTADSSGGQKQSRQGGRQNRQGGQQNRQNRPRQQKPPTKKPVPPRPDLAEVLEEELHIFEATARIVEENSESAEELRRESVKHIEVLEMEIADEQPVNLPQDGLAEPKKDGEDAPSPPPDESEAEMNAPMPHPHRKQRKRMNKRERMTAILGIIMSFFVLIGLIATVQTIVNVSSNLANSTAEKDEFARYIFPLVIIDTPEFESPDLLDNSQIISAAIWAFIIDDNDKSKYPHDDLGGMTVPDVDMEPYIRRMFGGEVKIKHQTVDGASFQMLYDEATKSYIIESTPRFLPYTPRVEAIKKDGDTYTLKVSYVQPDVVWNLDKEHKTQSVDKVMEYVLKKKGSTYEIRSVKLLEITGAEATPTEPVASLYGEVSVAEEQIVSDLPSQPGEEAASGTEAQSDTGASITG